MNLQARRDALYQWKQAYAAREEERLIKINHALKLDAVDCVDYVIATFTGTRKAHNLITIVEN